MVHSVFRRAFDNSVDVHSTPFITYSAVAIAVVVIIIVLIIVRLALLNRRRLAVGDPAMYYRGIPMVPDIPPPPLYECKVAPTDHLNAPTPLRQWQEVQPLSVAFDRESSQAFKHITSQINPPKSWTRSLKPSASAPTTVQTTFLITLPTPQTPFPDHLRRRTHTQVHSTAKTNTSDPLVAQGQPTIEISSSGEAPAAMKPQRAPSIRSTASRKEIGEARRDALLEQMGLSRPGSRQDLHHSASQRSHLSSANQAILHRQEQENEVVDTEAAPLGALALGSVALEIRAKGPRGKQAKDVWTVNDIRTMIDRAKNLREATATTT
ncbi:hypothetical protein ACI68E_000398 [Malassezia pachydermatis]